MSETQDICPECKSVDNVTFIEQTAMDDDYPLHRYLMYEYFVQCRACGHCFYVTEWDDES